MQATAQAQPNIALIKYWGKEDTATNFPAVDSLSITLDSLWTRTSVDISGITESDLLLINGTEQPSMLPRVSRCLDMVLGADRSPALVDSESNFPLAAGLASSASAFAALVVAAEGAAGGDRGTLELARLAGSASGSAARSLYDGFVELTRRENKIDLQVLRPPAYWPLKVVVAITEDSAKATGSGDAMIRSAETSPFFREWVDNQDGDMDDARRAIVDRDFERLARVAEHNCLKMHSVMWTSRPPVVYWNSATLACMQTVRDMRTRDIPVFFTIDAGPQIKAVCLPEAESLVLSELQDTPGVVKTMVSGLGSGASIARTS